LTPDDSHPHTTSFPDHNDWSLSGWRDDDRDLAVGGRCSHHCLRRYRSDDTTIINTKMSLSG
jgi:hypothetical protein